jgi:hypothetical protein
MEGSRERGCSRSGSPDAENAHFGKLGVRREGRRHRGRKPRPAANHCTGPEGHAGWNFGFNARFISEAEWNATVNVNLTAVFNLTQAVLEDMIARKEGTIITVSSLAVVNPNLLGGAAYGAAKAGVKNFMTFLHNTYRNQGIRATTILPGETDTPIMNNRARPPLEGERAVMLNPHDVARAVLLCASLQKGAVIPELHICPTFMRDTSADIETARWVGAPEGLSDKPKT